MSYIGHLLVEGVLTPLQRMQLVYSTAPAEWPSSFGAKLLMTLMAREKMKSSQKKSTIKDTLRNV